MTVLGWPWKRASAARGACRKATFKEKQSQGESSTLNGSQTAEPSRGDLGPNAEKVLAELPWMRDFEGNPSRIVDAAQALKPWKAAKPDEARPAKGKFVKVLAVHPNGEADKLLLRDTMTMAEIIETKAPGELRAVELEVLVDDFLVPPDATLRDFLDEDRSSGPITLKPCCGR